MGQCMQITITSTKLHPYLGCLIEFQQSKAKYLKLSLPLLNEEQYISWSKNINKLRYNSWVKEYMYLPIRQKFNQSSGMCQNSNLLQLIFLPYNETLKQTLIKNINCHRYFHQSYIWYLLYVLVRYMRYFQNREEGVKNLTLDNLLVFHDGSVKIVPENILPNHDLVSTLYAELDDQHQNSTDNSNCFQSKVKHHFSEVYVIGLICLSMADLIHPSRAYDYSQQSWKLIGNGERRQGLKNCQKRYSSLLVQTLTELTEKSKQKQINLQALYKRLQMFENQILAKKQLGLGLNLGYSSIQSVKTSICVQNKTVGINNSNLFRLSSVSNQYNQNTGRKRQEDIIYQEDYLNIL